MTPMFEPWLVPAIAALILNGVVVFVPKLALQSMNVLHVAVYHYVFFLIAALVLQPFFGALVYEPRGAAIAFISGVVGTGAQLLYLYALTRGPVTYVSLVTALYPLVAVVLAVVFLGETLGARQAAGIALGIASIVLLVAAHDDKK